MARSGAAMFAGATFLGFSQALTPEGPESSLVPGFFAVAFVILLLLRGAQLPIAVLGAFGPVGIALIGVALATSPGPGDGAVLYIWPVLWMAFFFGISGTALAVATVAVVQAFVLIALPADSSYIDRWFDVVVSVGIVGAVVQTLAVRYTTLLNRFAEEARVDTLTGLLNRRAFEERVPQELARSVRDGTWVGVASFDIDHFKHVNDDWGHDEGDRVIVALADAFRDQTRDSDLVVRMGGEEFVTLLWSSDLEETRAYAERVRSAFARVPLPDGTTPTISAGVTAQLAPADIGPLLRDADAALYRAKDAGRDRVVVDPQADSAPGPGRSVPSLAG
jgi:diguanylate cyclase (GGDEF)-like protein